MSMNVSGVSFHGKSHVNRVAAGRGTPKSVLNIINRVSESGHIMVEKRGKGGVYLREMPVRDFNRDFSGKSLSEIMENFRGF